MRHKEVPTTIREGSLKAEVYNEALCAYLCDESYETEIERIIDASEEEFPAEDSNEVADFRPLADRGLLLTYELYQDDSLSIHIAVGEPATPEEKKAVPMLKALRGFLSLPTGKLKIHSANTAPWGNPSDEDEPALVEVPPGDYIASVHHIDFDKLGEWTNEEDSEYALPIQFITLTPVSEAKPLKKRTAFLSYP